MGMPPRIDTLLRALSLFLSDDSASFEEHDASVIDCKQAQKRTANANT